MSVVLEQTEKEWDAVLFNSRTGLAPTLGWTLVYHTLRSKGSQAGFPDRICLRERQIVVELKRESGKPTADQVRWLDGFAAAGVETYLWRPSDLQEVGDVLAHRWTWRPVGGSLFARGSTFHPNSLWVAGRGRRDTLTD